MQLARVPLRDLESHLCESGPLEVSRGSSGRIKHVDSESSLY